MAGEKDLAMLTIDGVSMRNVFTDKNIGESIRNAASGSVSAGSSIDIAPITITEPGAYLITIGATFEPATSTGATTCVIAPNYVGFATGSRIRIINATHETTSVMVAQIMHFNASQVPMQICSQLYSSKARACSSETKAIRLALYPDIEE